MSEGKRVIALDNFYSSDNNVYYVKNSSILVIQEDPSGYYYFGNDEKGIGGWFLKTMVMDYVEPITEPKIIAPIKAAAPAAPIPINVAQVSTNSTLSGGGGFMTQGQMDAYNLMQGMKKVAAVVPDVGVPAKKAPPIPQQDAEIILKKSAPGPPIQSDEPIIKKKAPSLPQVQAVAAPVSTINQDLMNSGISWSDMATINALMSGARSAAPGTNTTPPESSQNSISRETLIQPSEEPMKKKSAPTIPQIQAEETVKKKAAPIVPSPQPIQQPVPASPTINQDLMNSGISWSDMATINALMSGTTSTPQTSSPVSKQTSVDSPSNTLSRKKAAPVAPGATQPAVFDSPFNTVGRKAAPEDPSIQTDASKKKAPAPPMPSIEQEEVVVKKKAAPVAPNAKEMNWMNMDALNMMMPPQIVKKPGQDQS